LQARRNAGGLIARSRELCFALIVRSYGLIASALTALHGSQRTPLAVVVDKDIESCRICSRAEAWRFAASKM
jgi:hypothetical protein